MFEPLLAGLRDLGCMSLTMSEAAPFAAARRCPGPRRADHRAGADELVQVAWSPP